MKYTRKRPQHCPREITGHWPGITYPDEFGCQARITVGDDRASKYFAYSAFENDPVAAHRAAARWVLALAKKHRKRGAEAAKLWERFDDWMRAGGASLLAAHG